MRWALPRLRLRVRLRGLCVLVALAALGMWGGLFFFSPTRRLTRQIQPDQPTYLRREAVGALGYVPFWEADEAIGVLNEALGDPSPRVRENALGGLGAHGLRARPAVPAILTAASDSDRNVRYTAFAVLGLVISPERRDPERDAAVAVLKHALDDSAPENRMAAAVSLLQLRENLSAYPMLARIVTKPGETYLSAQARHYVRQYGTNAELSAWVVPLLRDENEARRQRALDLLLEIATPDMVAAGLRNALGDDHPEVRQWAAAKLDSLTPVSRAPSESGEPPGQPGV